MVMQKLPRSISLPAAKLPGSPRQRPSAAKTYPTRSSSLPAHLHPLAAHIDSQLDTVLSWSSSYAADPSLACLAAGLAHLHLLLLAFADLLLLPEAQIPLRRLLTRRRNGESSSTSPMSSSFAETLLDDLLHLTDAYGSFCTDVLDLRHRLSATRAALRRNMIRAGGKPCRLAPCVQAQRRAEREVARLMLEVQNVGRNLPVLAAANDAEEDEMGGIMREVMAAAAAASTAMFIGVASVSAASVAAAPVATRCRWVEAALKWRARARARLTMMKMWAVEGKVDGREEKWWRTTLDRLEALEKSVTAAESGGEKVFRALVNTRVSLLNILTPVF